MGLVFVQRLKLRPPQILPLWMERPQLERRLHPGTLVVSIVAGPGYGKTVLAARMHAAWKGLKLWYSLDEGDADIALFATHLNTGIRSMGAQLPPFDDANAGAVGVPREVAVRFAEGLADISPETPPLLVFDDVQALEGSRSLLALNELVERACRFGVSFVLSGRSMPLTLHSIAAAAQLGSVGAADLAFDSSEALSYLQRATSGRTTEAAEVLVARAEGWPAGLALIASSSPDIEVFQRETPAEPMSGEEGRRHLFSYLANEVIERLSEDERQFLQDTSILDQLETSLCDAVLDRSGSAKILESLAARGLFVTRQSDDAYRSHQLFRDFLLHYLSHSSPRSHLTRLHGRAAVVLAARGDAAPAVTHFVQAGDPEAAAEELESAAFAMLRAGLIGTVSNLLRMIPQDRLNASPTLLVALGRVQRERGEWDAALPSLERAIGDARAARQFDVLAEAVRACAPILASRGEFERLRVMLDEALSSGLDLPETSVTSLRMTLAAVYLEMNLLDDSLAAYREIMPSIVARGDLAAHGLVLHNTAVANVRRGDIYAGLSLYERALKLKETAGHRISLLTTLGDLIYVKTLLGDVEEAERLVETMLAQATDIGASGLVTRAHEQRGVLKLLRGDAEGAVHAFRGALEASDPSDMILLPEIEHGLAKCALLQGNLAEADEFCARAIEMFRRAARHQQMAPLLVTRAEVMLAKSDAATAAKLADQAVTDASRGDNALVEAMACLDAAIVLVRCAASLSGTESARAERRAAEAATSAVALVHQRDYRFLLRTKAAAFKELYPHLRRWKIGLSLIPEIAADAPVASLRIETLGPLRVYVGAKEVPPDAWKRRRALEIFAFLASQRGRPVPRERLVDLYWPESDADAAHDSLRVTITAIRKAVGDVIKYEANAYRFAPPPQTTIDFEQFDVQMEEARQADSQGDRDKARRCYQVAADLYGGDFLDGMHEGGWQWRERERLRASCIEALRWVASDCQSRGDGAGHRRTAERLLEVAPFDLDAVRTRLESLCAEMRFSEAVRDYGEWRARYKAAVGADAPDVWHPPESLSDRPSVAR